MAKAYVSIHSAFLPLQTEGSAVLGLAEYSVVLNFASGQANSAALQQGAAAGRRMVASISTDADCFIAIGTAPNCDIEALSDMSSARVFLAGGASMDLYIPLGAKVGVKAVA